MTKPAYLDVVRNRVALRCRSQRLDEEATRKEIDLALWRALGRKVEAPKL